MPPLSHRQKFRRAIEHLGPLNAAIARWVDLDPCTIIYECEVQTRKHIFRARIDRQPDDALIPLLIGDVVHNMRQGLDHLAYRLAIAAHGKDPPPNEGTSEFPIILSKRDKFDSDLGRKIASKDALDPALYAALERLQPYNGGDRYFLAVLHELDRLDKHRFLPVVAGVADVPSIYYHRFTGRAGGLPRAGSFEDGAPLFEFFPEADSEVDVEFNFEPSIAFAQSSPIAPGQPVLPLLHNIAGFVLAEVFPVLEPFAP